MENMIKGSGSFVAEFFEFLKKFGVIGLAIGVVVGGAVKEYVDAIVKSIVNPIVAYILELMSFKAGGAIALPSVNGQVSQTIMIGDLISATINFLVLMFIVFIAVKFFVSRFMHENDMKNSGV
jgi:large conductance mechanosensitive channel